MIIRTILEKVMENGFFTMNFLAEELSMDEKLLQTVIEDLKRDGYLSNAKKMCDIMAENSKCKTCSGCHLRIPKDQYGNALELTDKAIEYLNR